MANQRQGWFSCLLSRAAGGAAAAAGTAVLLFPGHSAMAPGTALSLILLGTAACACGPGLSARATGAVRLAAAAAGLVGVATLLDAVLGLPNRMAPDTAACLVCMASATWLKAPQQREPAASAAAVTLSLLAAAGGLTVLFWTAAVGPVGWFGMTGMAASSAALLSALGAATAVSIIREGEAHWLIDASGTAAFVLGLLLVLITGLHTNHCLASEDRFVASFGTFAGLAALVAGMLQLNAVLLRQRRAAQSLRESEEKYRGLFQGESDAVFLIDGETRRIEEANAAAARLYGRAVAELRSLRMEQLSAEPERTLRGLAETVAGVSPGVIPAIRHRKKDGSEFTVEVSRSTFRCGGRIKIIAAIRDLTERRRAEAQLLLLSSAIEQTSEAVVVTDASSEIVYVNGAFTAVTGYSRGEALGRNPRILQSGRHPRAFYEEMWATLARGETWRGRLFNRRKSGEVYEEDCSIAPVRGQGGAVTHYIAVKRDVSRERELEKQFLHSQRLEAVGRLAGGIAHDFNNLLSAIMGSAHMLGTSVRAGTQEAEDVAAILDAGGRAAALTRQMLTFSRRQPAGAAVLDLSASVRGIQKIVGRTLGEDVRVSVSLAEAPVWIEADPGQVDQVILNLAVNARDAMPGGGGLELSTSVRELARTRVTIHDTAPAGVYGVLRCEDTGSGRWRPRETPEAPPGRGTGTAEARR